MRKKCREKINRGRCEDSGKRCGVGELLTMAGGKGQGAWGMEGKSKVKRQKAKGKGDSQFTTQNS